MKLSSVIAITSLHQRFYEHHHRCPVVAAFGAAMPDYSPHFSMLPECCFPCNSLFIKRIKYQSRPGNISGDTQARPRCGMSPSASNDKGLINTVWLADAGFALSSSMWSCTAACGRLSALSTWPEPSVPWVSNDLQALLLGECNNCRHKLWCNLEQATC